MNKGQSNETLNVREQGGYTIQSQFLAHLRTRKQKRMLTKDFDSFYMLMLWWLKNKVKHKRFVVRIFLPTPTLHYFTPVFLSFFITRLHPEKRNECCTGIKGIEEGRKAS